MLNKKSQMKMIVAILLVILGFFLLASLVQQFFGKAEGKTAEAICRGSVALHTSYLDFGGLKKVRTPLLCYTQDITIKPKGRTEVEQKDSVMRQVADKMASCWFMFGEGNIENVFGGSALDNNKCMPCYTFDIDKGSLFDKDISSEDFMKFWVDTTYKIESDSEECMNFGGFCIADTDTSKKEIQTNSNSIIGWKYDKLNSICKDKYKDASNGDDKLKTGCYYNSYTCLNKGGVCEAPNCGDGMSPLPSDVWNCPETDQKCCVPTDKYFSYKNYVQFYGGKGLTAIATDLKGGSKDRYAITFADVSKGCGDNCWQTVVTGAAIGAGVAVATVGVVALTVTTLGVGTIILGSAAAGVIGGGAISIAAPKVTDVWKDLFNKRDLPTIYLSTVDQLGENCSVYKK